MLASRSKTPSYRRAHLSGRTLRKGKCGALWIGWIVRLGARSCDNWSFRTNIKTRPKEAAADFLVCISVQSTCRHSLKPFRRSTVWNSPIHKSRSELYGKRANIRAVIINVTIFKHGFHVTVSKYILQTRHLKKGQFFYYWGTWVFLAVKFLRTEYYEVNSIKSPFLLVFISQLWYKICHKNRLLWNNNMQNIACIPFPDYFNDTTYNSF